MDLLQIGGHFQQSFLLQLLFLFVNTKIVLFAPKYITILVKLFLLGIVCVIFSPSSLVNHGSTTKEYSTSSLRSLNS